MKSILLFLAALGFSSACIAQPHEEMVNTDSLFLHAREKAFTGKYGEAQILLDKILKNYPTHTDARLLLARSFVWDGNYEKARQEIKIILQNEPAHEEALMALVDIATWSHHYEEGLKEVIRALSHHPASEPLLFRKAQLLSTLQAYEEAHRSITALVAINPEHEEGLKLDKNINEKLFRYEASISLGVDQFNHTFDPAYYSAVQMSRKNTWGLATIRTNYTKRFGLQGIQPEVEIYPTLSKKTYAYINYGYSESILFPTHRIGAELYTKISKNTEGSLGLRHLDFGTLNKVWMYTGSIGWYKKNYWITLRPSIIANQTMTTYATYFAVRKYFKDEGTYLGMSVSMGLLPDERRLQSGVGVNTDRSYTLKSKSVGLVFTKALAANFTIRMNYEFTYREIAFDSNSFIWIHTSQVALSKKF